MNWNLFVTELVAGIVHGSVYALIALGYSMVYGILKLLNFAHGDIFMVGSFIGYGMLTVFGGAPSLSLPIALLLVLMFLAAMLGGGLLGVVIERFAYRRLRDAPRIAPLITALGVSFFLENAALLVLGADYQSFNTYSWDSNSSGLGVLWSQRLHASRRRARRGCADHRRRRHDRADARPHLVRQPKTQLGRAMRATSFDRQAAEMMGIDVNRVIAVTFFIGSALAGAAGIFNGLVYQQVWPYMGFDAGLKAFTAAVVGGIGNLPGAVVGGLAIGLAEAFTIGYLSSTFSDAIVFVILIGGDDPPPERAARARGGAEGLMAARATRRLDAATPGIGDDEWVASLGGRRERAGGPLAARPGAVASGSRQPVLFFAFGIVAALFPLFTNNGYYLRVGFDTLTYMLLALGLNIVVGFAGLLDLGYVAFFGFGAYGYAMLASSAVRHPLADARRSCRRGDGRDRAARPRRRAALAPPRRRLPRDRDALLRAAVRHRDKQRRVDLGARASRASYNVTNGPNGIANIDPFHLFGHQLESLRELLLRRARLLPRRALRRLPREQVAHGPGLALAARGPARRRADGDAGQPAEAARVRLRRRRRRAHGDALRLAQHRRLLGRLRHPDA